MADDVNRFGPELILLAAAAIILLLDLALSFGGGGWERAPLLALTAVIVAVGVYPAVMLDLLETGVVPIAERLS